MSDGKTAIFAAKERSQPSASGNHPVQSAGTTPGAPKRIGRKPGKHSNENYTQTSIYLPTDLRNRVRAKLYEKGMEMSGLVEHMLRGTAREPRFRTGLYFTHSLQPKRLIRLYAFTEIGHPMVQAHSRSITSDDASTSSTSNFM